MANKETQTWQIGIFEDAENEEQLQEEGGAEAEGGAVDLKAVHRDRVRLLNALKAVKQGDFSVRLPVDKGGIMSEIAMMFNDVVALNENMANEVIRVSKVVGEEGKLTERASLGQVTGSWKMKIDSINGLINNLAQPTIEVGRVITAVAEGDLTKKMRLEIEDRPLKGEFLRIGTRVNTMVDQLSSFTEEVTRVAKEVGTDGKLGGQAEVKGVSVYGKVLQIMLTLWQPT